MLFIAVLIAAVGFGLLVYRYDMYEREPWYMLLLAVGLGIAAFWFLSYAEDMILARLPGGGTSHFAQAAVAGICEELMKLLIVLGIWCFIPRHFNDPFDGLIYGAMTGLGLAVGESAFYLDLMGDVPWVAGFGQETVRLILHLLMGALTCVGLGLARFRVPRWPQILVGSVAAAMALHFAWDYFCGLPSQDPQAALQQRLIAVALMLTALGMFGYAVRFAMKRSGDAHAINRLKDLWGWPFTGLSKKRKQR